MSNLQKNSITVGSIIFALAAIGGIVHFYSKQNETIVNASVKTPKVVAVDMQFATDLRDDRKLIGASHNIFVGKVINKSGSKEVPFDARLNLPISQFSVEIISNVKGNLSGTVTVNQMGGYKDKTLYIVHGGDVIGPSLDGQNYLLEPGSTYLFVTRYNNGTYDLWTYSGALTLISQNNALNEEQLRAMTAENNRVITLKNAYPHEILWSFDIRDQNTRNSYQSIQASFKNLDSSASSTESRL